MSSCNQTGEDWMLYLRSAVNSGWCSNHLFLISKQKPRLAFLSCLCVFHEEELPNDLRGWQEEAWLFLKMLTANTLCLRRAKRLFVCSLQSKKLHLIRHTYRCRKGQWVRQTAVGARSRADERVHDERQHITWRKELHNPTKLPKACPGSLHRCFRSLILD